jgi:hypothetical protein
VLLCSSSNSVASLVRVVLVVLALTSVIWSVMCLVLVCLSGSGVVGVLSVLPSGRVMWFYPPGLVLSWSVTSISRNLV